MVPPRRCDQNTIVATIYTQMEEVEVEIRQELNVRQPSREVICMDSLKWFDTIPEDTGFGENASVFTSLPDVKELSEIFHGYMFKEYKEWFISTLEKLMSKIKPGNYLILLQSDCRLQYSDQGMFEWLDKSHLASIAADRSGMTLVWHKLVLCNKTMEKRSSGKPSYSHLLCYSKNGCRGCCESIEYKNITEKALALHCGCPPVTHKASYFSIPDIFHRGEMLWVRGIGLDCCYAGVMFLRDIAKATKIIDPFAGVGTVLAMANALGVDAVGVEISSKRCRKARNITVTSEHLANINHLVKRIALNDEVAREGRELQDGASDSDEH